MLSRKAVLGIEPNGLPNEAADELAGECQLTRAAGMLPRLTLKPPVCSVVDL
jgi:hypothetical protein